MGKKTMQTTLNPSEISELIKKRVEELDISAETRNEGTVVSVSDGIARIHGLELEQVHLHELGGLDIVFAYPLEKQDTRIKKAGSRLNGYLNRLIFKKPKGLKLSSFRILTKPLVRRLIKIETHSPYLSGMIFSITNHSPHPIWS